MVFWSSTGIERAHWMDRILKLSSFLEKRLTGTRKASNMGSTWLGCTNSYTKLFLRLTKGCLMKLAVKPKIASFFVGPNWGSRAHRTL